LSVEKRARSATPAKKGEWPLSLPSLVWLAVLVLLPSLIVLAVAFKPADPYGGVGAGWTLTSLRDLARESYLVVGWRTLYLSLLTTAACLLLATPMAYFMARAPRKWRHTLLLLVVVPFWTSFLVRIFAWKVVLHPEGPVKRGLAALHLVSPDATLLYNPGAVLLVMVYTSLPFAILPIYAAAERFDFSLLEAARDLGARSLVAFWSVFMPGIRRGLASAALLVFIPSLGSYIVPDIVGGPSGEMIGNIIAQRVFSDRNLPHASALSVLLTLLVLAPMLAALVLRGRQEEVAARRAGPE
jgi:spermidine/putrescine transport system permease protein